MNSFTKSKSCKTDAVICSWKPNGIALCWSCYQRKIRSHWFLLLSHLLVFFRPQFYLISAASCIRRIPYTWELSSVRVGRLHKKTDCNAIDNSSCTSPSTVDMKIGKKFIHNDYREQSRSQHNDIALLRLAKKAKFNKLVKPICLPLSASLWTKDYSNETFEVAGLCLPTSKHSVV